MPEIFKTGGIVNALNRIVEKLGVLVVNQTNPYKARAYLPTLQENLVNNTWTLVNLTAESYDVNNNFDTTNKKYVVPVSGYYNVTGAIMYVNPVISKKYSIGIYKNGTATLSSNGHASVADFFSVSISDVLYFEAGDEITLYARSVSGDNTVDINNAETVTYLTIHWLSQ